MKFAKVVLGLPVEGPFDYSIPAHLEKNAIRGVRVRVSFGKSKKVGYIVNASRKSSVEKVKPIIEILDERPILDANLIKLSKKISSYYCSTLGLAIEAMLPKALREGRQLPCNEFKAPIRKSPKTPF